MSTRDDITEIIRSSVEDQSSLDAITGSVSGRNDDIPGLREYQEQAKQQHARLLRRSKMHFAGADPWPDAKTALEITSDYCQQEFVKMSLLALAAGVEVGRDASLWKSDFNKLFSGGSQDFFSGTAVRALMMSMDEGVLDLIARHFAECVVQICDFMSFRESEGKQTARVWDVWYGALGATSLSMYVVGVKLGRKWTTDEIFSNSFESESD